MTPHEEFEFLWENRRISLLLSMVWAMRRRQARRAARAIWTMSPDEREAARGQIEAELARREYWRQLREGRA